MCDVIRPPEGIEVRKHLQKNTYFFLTNPIFDFVDIRKTNFVSLVTKEMKMKTKHFASLKHFLCFSFSLVPCRSFRSFFSLANVVRGIDEVCSPSHVHLSFSVDVLFPG